MSRRNTDQWDVDRKNVVEFLHSQCKLKDRFSEDLIQQACGILQVNAFEGQTSFATGCNLQCLFPKSGLTAHSCVPNVNHSIYPSDQFKLVECNSCNDQHLRFSSVELQSEPQWILKRGRRCTQLTLI